ncbi:LD-carboxypeptidase [Algivirga pacifica]|uniref:LD-carboxypeptidase n=1 Tax=Algivirga pacifica TaxID=1162670 RepID=A0ABP9CX49_9BACT
MHTIQPPFLQANDTIAIVAPAGKVDRTKVEASIPVLESWGLRVKIMPHVYAENGSMAGTDSQRLQDIQEVLDNPEVKTILCARGGYGSTRIIDQLDWTKFQKNPKWLIGFSDITAFLLHLNQMGYQSIHGPMGIHLFREDAQASTEMLRQMMMGESLPQIQAPAHSGNRIGEAKGSVIGGNIALLASSIGTPSQLNTDGKILFIEEIGEYPYTIDRMLGQMQRAGLFNNLKGLVIGQFTDIKPNDGNPFPLSIEDIILEKVATYDYPVSFGMDIGHDQPNFPVICGAEAELKVTEEGSELSF